MQLSARQYRATSTAADPPPFAGLWTLPTIVLGLFVIIWDNTDNSVMPYQIVMLTACAVCATPVVAAFVDSRAIVPVWLAGSMLVVATVVIAVSSRWKRVEGGGDAVILVAVFVATYAIFIAAVFTLRFLIRCLRRR
jgi:hypothetical protein